jgi:hypothetical protein
MLIAISEIIPSSTKLPKSLTKLFLSGGYLEDHSIPLAFVSRFTNLQELELSFIYDISEEFKKLQYATFSQLKILIIYYECLKYEMLINFLEINGKNLRECYIGYLSSVNDNSLNLAIANFCPNLRKISVGFKNNELETLKMVFNNCQYLESIYIWCGGVFLSEKNALEMVGKYSPKNVCELRLVYQRTLLQSELLPEELESFFISWASNISKKPLSLIVSGYPATSFDAENMKIIDKYIKLGIIKKFHKY